MVKSEIIKKKLSNGLTIIFLKNKEKKVLINVAIGTGHLSEKANNQGVSHFIEHVLWEGSKNYPNYASIKDVTEKLNLEYNAFTGATKTGYYIVSSRKNFENALDLILNVVQNPLFNEGAIEKQRKIIFNELNQHEDHIQYQSMKLTLDYLLPDEFPRFNPMGSKESLASLTKEDLKKHYSTYYATNNMVIVISGDIKSPFKLIEKKITLSSKKIPKKAQLEMKNISGEVISKLVKNTGTSYITQVYPAVPSTHKDSEPLNVISTMLCEGRLCLQDIIWQEKGLTYNCWSKLLVSDNSGVFNIGLSSGKENVNEIKDLIKNHLKKLKNVKQKDVDKAKRSIIRELKEDKGDPVELSQKVIACELDDEWDEFYNTPSKVACVTKQDVQRVAKKYFGENYLISLIEQAR